MSELHFKALLIGNGTYPKDPHNLPDLKGPPNDLRILEEALVHPQVGLFQKEDVQVLQDCTKDEIMESAFDFFDSAKRFDQLLFYYSGHGLLDKFNNFYFCTRSTRINALIPTAISDEVLNSMIRQSISSRVVIVIDCCHSGRFKSAGMSESLKGEGRFIITSSRSKELSEDATQADQPSAFTKYVVEALLSSEVDTNKDGYISINELYDYVLPKIYENTKQRPHRIFDKAVGELALAKSNVDSPMPVAAKAGSSVEKPVLSVSTNELFIDDVEDGEILPDEIIDVFNEGGGKLDWTYECDDDWIEIEKFKGHIKLKFQPISGINRGRVYIRDQRSGQAKRIQIRVRVHQSVRPPKLQLAEDVVDFGTVSRDAKAPSQTLRLVNLGDGDLNARATTKDDWVDVDIFGDILEISAHTKEEGRFVSSVRVDSAGGTVSIPVQIVVEPGPILKVTPIPISFATVQQGKEAKRKIKVQNIGKGELTWDFKTKGSFFSAERRGGTIDIVLDSGKIGKKQGSVFISSNGGEKTVPVKALVKGATQPPPPSGGFVDIGGTWESAGGIGQFTGTGPNYQYHSANLMGVTVEQGTAHVVGNKVTLEVYNVMTGNHSATLQVHGNTMSGTMTTLMGVMPVTLQRSGGAPVQNFLANLFS
jgi:hypothetical protein